ncbi:LysR family transcriptional regulator [Pseudorhodoferax sp. Leaf265]|uniref:LysR family transcriptional regulator n=1 Tax=Pseudorhodoferax sp. Leaf265 TaxID=1736315 RepID=UPI0006F85940|nr:LysR family transcriptional regulator [Pseudorhodoferax sp. Leaf265]KQP20730.1 LysR family transcriptional regulator [Pseudorhodoferax sp. Leaf265]
MDIKLVEAFVLLMRSGSLTRAAVDSGVPKATLSRQVARLEELLGVQLVVRSARRLSPTEAGRAFHAHGEQLLVQLQDGLASAQAQVRDMASGDAGSLTVLTDTHFSTTFLCGMVRRYIDQHPNVRCTLAIADRPASPAIDTVDCYLCSEPPDLPHLVAKPLGRLAYSLYASPRYLAGHAPPQRPADLADHVAVVLRERLAGRAGLQLNGRDASFTWTPRVAADTNDYWVLKTFCLDGLGIAALPDFFCAPEVQAGGLRVVLPGWHTEPLRVYAVYQKQRFMARKLRGFIDMIAGCIDEIAELHQYVGSPGRAPRGGGPAPSPRR